MTDRGPELFMLDLSASMIQDHRDDPEEPWVQVDGEAYPATPADLVAAVRAAVESGTIEEEVQWLCRENDRVHDWALGSPPHCWFMGEGKHNPECGPHLVIPLVERGEES